MSTNFCSIIVLFFGCFCVGGRAQTACKDLPQAVIDFSMMVSGSPYNTLLSSDPSYNCSTAIMTGPAPLDGTNYTLVLLQNNTLKASLNVYPKEDNNKTMVMTCDQGDKFEYYFWAQTLDYSIVYICDNDTVRVSLLRVYAHTDVGAQTVNAIIQQKNITLSSGGPLYNARYGCGPAPYCQGYNF